jgi:tripartite-type tricarboxylate transporter receptor subunit TctC
MRRFLLTAMALLAVTGIVVSGAPAPAAAYPDDPVFMVVPYPPGGPNDLLARAINGQLGEVLGQPVVIDNRGGAGGNVGTEYVVAADNDGYTLLLHGMGVAVNASLYAQARYNPIEDLAPVAMVAETPLVLVVPASLPVENVGELIAHIRERPGEMNFGSGGAGTSLHLAAVRFMDVADLELEHIPYQGNARVIPDLVSARVNLLFSSISTALPHIESGDLKALAVTTQSRSQALPDVPTVAESGLPDYEFGAWYTIVAPAGTPEDIRQQLNEAVNTVLQMPEVQEQFARMGANPLTMSVEETGDFIAAEYEDWRQLVEDARLTID